MTVHVKEQFVEFNPEATDPENFFKLDSDKLASDFLNVVRKGNPFKSAAYLLNSGQYKELCYYAALGLSETGKGVIMEVLKGDR